MFEVSDYEVIEEIGRGGMATVYKALQPSLNRFVALKVLPSHFAHDPEFVTRFRREALAVAKLRHPNIVQVYNFHEEDGLFYLAMEYVEGGSLFDLMKKAGPLPLKFTAEITGQVAAALHHAHQKGFIHRDIKPSNILLTAERQAVLTDFGITKAVEGTKLTKTANFSGGTSEYISPEQAKGIAVDGRSDLYSLGIVWYEMVTGHCPFEKGNPFAVIHSQIYDEPPKPTAYNPEISEDTEKTILKLLEKDPDQRYRNGKQLIADINKLDLPEIRDEDFPTLIRSRLDPSETLLKIDDELTRIKEQADKKSADPDVTGTYDEVSEPISPIISGDHFSVATSAIKEKTGEPPRRIRMQIPVSEDSPVENADFNDKKTAIKIKPAVSSKPKTKEAASKTGKDGKSGKKESKKKPAPKLVTKRKTEAELERSPWVIRMAVAVGILAVVASAFFILNLFGRNSDIFHYQFRPVSTLTGGATVSREVNIQSKGDSDAFVIALKVKGGSGEIEIRESVPKSLAVSASMIDFEKKPMRVVKGDPVLMWKLKPKKDGVNIIYRVFISGRVTKEKFDRVVNDFKSLPRLDKLTIVSGGNRVLEGGSVVLNALGIKSDESTTTAIPVSWKSENIKIATVDKNGVIKGIKAGSVKITARSGKLIAFISLKVLPVLRELEIVPNETSLQTGGSVDFKALGKFSDGSTVDDLSVEWSVSDTGIASIGKDGLLIANSAGEVEVVAKSGEIRSSVKVSVSSFQRTAQPQAGKKKNPSDGGSGATDPYAVGPQPINSPSPSQPVDPIPIDVK